MTVPFRVAGCTMEWLVKIDQGSAAAWFEGIARSATNLMRIPKMRALTDTESWEVGR
jgi:hypothetical protein